MNTSQQLQEALSAWQSMQMAEHHLSVLQERLAQKRRELRQLEHLVDKEYQDIVRLEKLGLPGLFRRILGDTEQQLELERQEYLQAVLQFRDGQKQIELLEFEQGVLESKLKEKSSRQQQLDQLLAQREQELLYLDHPIRKKLDHFNLLIDQQVLLQREIYEAKIVGAKANTFLHTVVNGLEDIADSNIWSYDLSPSQEKQIKRKFDRLQEHLWTLRPLLTEFLDELKDIYEHQDLQVLHSLDEFSHALNGIRFYENLISDWIVRKKVHNALYQLHSVWDYFSRTLRSLDRHEKKINEQMKNLEEEKKECLKQVG